MIIISPYLLTSGKCLKSFGMNLWMNELNFDRIEVWLLGWFDGCGDAARLRFPDLSQLLAKSLFHFSHFNHFFAVSMI